MSAHQPNQFPAPADPHVDDLLHAPGHERQFVSELLEHSMAPEAPDAPTRREEFAGYAGELATELRLQQQAQFYVDKAISWNGFVKPENDTEVAVDAPKGFSEAILIPKGALIETDSLEKSIQSLSHDDIVEGHFEADALVLKTDAGEAIRFTDLRDKMSSSVRKGGPETKQQKARLDRAFFSDLKMLADQGHAPNRVSGVQGVYYSKVPDSKLRAYWMIGRDERADGVKTAVRIADCADSVAKEIALYRQLFGMTIRL
jgi:hypothetical protein